MWGPSASQVGSIKLKFQVSIGFIIWSINTTRWSALNTVYHSIRNFVLEVKKADLEVCFLDLVKSVTCRFFCISIPRSQSHHHHQLLLIPTSLLMTNVSLAIGSFSETHSRKISSVAICLSSEKNCQLISYWLRLKPFGGVNMPLR